jgi:hypothetical protein
MLVLTNIGKQISKPKKGGFLYIFFRETKKKTDLPGENQYPKASNRTEVADTKEDLLPLTTGDLPAPEARIREAHSFPRQRPPLPGGSTPGKK